MGANAPQLLLEMGWIPESQRSVVREKSFPLMRTNPAKKWKELTQFSTLAVVARPFTVVEHQGEL